MSSQRSAKPLKPPNQSTPLRSPSVSSSSLSSHLAMVELKQRILNSLSKLADRDTHQIALEDMEKIIQSLSNDGVSMFLNCLYDAVNDPKPAVKKEAVRLFAALCIAHTDPAATHLTKMIAHVVKRLKDTDSQVREACLDAIGSLAGLYLKGGCGGDGVASLFLKPLFEAMSENNRVAQGGAALGLAKVVESAAEPPLANFQKLLTRVCKYLNCPNFMAKASLLQVVSSLSQVGAIGQQSMDSLLQSIHECLCSSDWATRKAAADTLVVLALRSDSITEEAAASTLKGLETCRFDKIKPVRESMNEALQLWKKVAGKAGGSSNEQKVSSQDGDASESDRKDLPNHCDGRSEKTVRDSSSACSPTDSKGNSILDKAVGILKKKAPGLLDKELNPQFFQKLEPSVSGDVEVVLPRRFVNSSNSEAMEGLESSAAESERARLNCHTGDGPPKTRYESTERGTHGDHGNNNGEPSSVYPEISRTPGQSEGFMNDNKGNWLAIQRQLTLLERQQSHLMNMLQDFMGGSHDSMVTLENRVRGLERVIEDMVRDLSISSSRRSSNSLAGVEGSSSRYISKWNGFPDYSSCNFGSSSNSRIHFGERYSRGPSWRPDASEAWNFQYSRNGHTGSRRVGSGGPVDIRTGEAENQGDPVGSRRAWEKGAGPNGFGEGPSARSVWQASKDQATLEAIRVAGEDNGVTQNSRVAIPEMPAGALGDDGAVQDRDPVWNSWSNAIDALYAGDMDSAFAEVLSIGDDALLVKLMDRSGPVIDQLTNEVASEVVIAISQFLTDQNMFDMCLYWLQQLADIVMENGTDVVGIPMEVKREILVNLHDSTSSVELLEDWEDRPQINYYFSCHLPGKLICKILQNSYLECSFFWIHMICLQRTIIIAFFFPCLFCISCTGGSRWGLAPCP